MDEHTRAGTYPYLSSDVLLFCTVVNLGTASVAYNCVVLECADIGEPGGSRSRKAIAIAWISPRSRPGSVSRGSIDSSRLLRG